jgi:hypothetical protein
MRCVSISSDKRFHRRIQRIGFMTVPDDRLFFATIGIAHEGTRISALIPATWEAVEVAENHLRLYSPPDPAYPDHRSTFSISLGEPDGFGPEGFEECCDASLATLTEKLPAFELRSRERSNLSSLVDVHAVWYSCGSGAGPGPAFAQLQALGLADRYNLYLINAATLPPGGYVPARI